MFEPLLDTDRKRILAMRFSALGDVAMTIPVVYSLARQHPTVHIDYVTTPFFARLFINPPVNLKVHTADLRGKYKGISGTVALTNRLADLQPDCVADLHNVLRTWIIGSRFKLAGVEVAMVDKMRDRRRKVTRDKGQHPSFFDRYANVFKELGFPVKMSFTTIFTDGIPPTSVPVEKPAVGIAPFARYSNKTYPLPLMEKVISALSAKGIHVYLFGARGEEASRLEEIAGRHEGCVSVAGKCPLEEELALMARMDVMTAMDSANHHMASLVATPVVSVWGSTSPVCGFMGYRQKEENAVMLGLPCQPCSIAGSDECLNGSFECLKALPPEKITDRILDILKC